MGRRLLIAAGGLALYASVLNVTPATAQEVAEYLTVDQVATGTCSPDVVLTGQLVDCRFPIPEGSVLDPWGPHYADVDVSYDEDDDDHPACAVAGDELVCRGVFAYYVLGGRDVSVVVSGVRSQVRASFRVIDSWTQPAYLTPEWGGEPYVFAGHPLSVWVDGPDRTAARFAAVRSREDGRLMATMALPAADPATFEPVAIDPGALPPGRYLITPCAGATPLGCTEVAGGVGFQVGAGALVEVIPGWNLEYGDRINVVFAPSGNTTPASALATIRSLLGWQGPLAIGEGDVVLEDPDPGEAWWVQFGPFAMEPLRSARHRFNLWMIDDVLVDPRALDHTAPPLGWDRPPPDFGLPDVAVTAFDVQYPGLFARSEALWPSFTTPDGPAVLVRRGLVFSSAYVSVSGTYPRAQAATLTHEWGHALFDLRDEYVEFERSVTHGYPNCAPDEVTARAWWGDLLGEVDPWLEEYLAVMDSFGMAVDALLRDRVRVDLVTGGCYSPDDDAVRPTQDSMMNSEIPIFGSVNRRRVEEVLALWSGRSPFAVESATVACDLVVHRERVGFCSLVLAPFVDAPEESVALVVGGQRSRCGPAQPQGDAIRLRCGVLRFTEGVPETVGLAVGGVVVAQRPLIISG